MRQTNDMAKKPPPKKPGSRIDPERIAFALEKWVSGLPSHNIARDICATYGVAKTTARQYVRLAFRELAKQPSSNPAALIARSESMLHEAAEIAREKGDSKGLATVAFRLAQLNGVVANNAKVVEETELLKARRLNETNWDEELTKATPEERTALLAFIDRIKARPAGGADEAASLKALEAKPR